jgi:hypothetical protein
LTTIDIMQGRMPGLGCSRSWQDWVLVGCGFRFIPAGFSDVKPATVPI